jgi:hypothetical protein
MQILFLAMLSGALSLSNVPVAPHYNAEIIFLHQQVTVAERSKACIVFARSEAGVIGSKSLVRIPLRAWMFSVCVCVCMCVLLCLCTSREALWRADHSPKESYRTSKIL